MCCYLCRLYNVSFMFRKFLCLSVTLFAAGSAFAQSGCTDPAASNYNPTAVTNDGSCIYPVTHNSPILKGAMSPTITESSGLEWTDGQLWTHNDSGNPPYIFKIDTTDGHTLQTVIIDNYPNTDWEDITADSFYIYVGDHGNNDGSRRDLKVLKIAKADITTGDTVHVNAQAIAFSYTDQTSFTPSHTNNFDCEALMSVGDSLYIFTKDRGDLSTRSYKMPKTPGTYALTPYTTYNVDGLITGADYNAATKEVVLVGYLSDHTHPFLWYLNDYEGDMYFSGNKRRIEIGGNSEWQTEGVAWVSASRYFISCETRGDTVASLYIDSKAMNTTTGVQKIHAAVTCSVFPDPATDVLHINGLEAKAAYELTNIAGASFGKGILAAGNNIISVKDMPTGNYIIRIDEDHAASAYIKFVKR